MSAGRETWVIGNWKQNLLRAPARELAHAVARGLEGALGDSRGVRVGIAPTVLALDAVAPLTGPGPRALRLLAQDVGAQESGAFTGELGPAMLAEAGVHAVIVGHSERRALFGDTDPLVAAKLACALSAGLGVVLCVGETLSQRDAGEQESVVLSQLGAALSQAGPRLDRVLVAYEPVWAIGTGRTATPAQASAMHRAIRAWLRETHGQAGADRSVLYGGSVKAANASDLLDAGDIDGFLVGGASLDPAGFLDIVRAAARAETPDP